MPLNWLDVPKIARVPAFLRFVDGLDRRLSIIIFCPVWVTVLLCFAI